MTRMVWSAEQLQNSFEIETVTFTEKGAVMQAVREIINSSVLSNVFNLPPELRNRTVEVLILPADEQLPVKPIFKPEEYIGVLKLGDAAAAARSIRDEWERC